MTTKREEQKNLVISIFLFFLSLSLQCVVVWTRSKRRKKYKSYRVVFDAYHHGSDTFIHCSDFMRFIDNDDNHDDKNDNDDDKKRHRIIIIFHHSHTAKKKLNEKKNGKECKTENFALG